MPDLPWYVYAMLLAPLALILFAAVYKSLQVRAASEWPSAPGKVNAVHGGSGSAPPLPWGEGWGEGVRPIVRA